MHKDIKSGLFPPALDAGRSQIEGIRSSRTSTGFTGPRSKQRLPLLLGAYSPSAALDLLLARVFECSGVGRSSSGHLTKPTLLNRYKVRIGQLL